MTRFDNLARIRALLAKTTEAGCTEAEAFAALSLANDLMGKYSISQEEVLEVEASGATVEGKTTYDPMNIRGAIAPVIARFTTTQVWESREGSKSRRTMKFCGERSDVEFAHWLLDSLYRFVCREMGRYVLANPTMGASGKNGFYVGATRRISERLDALTAARTHIMNSNARALVVVKDALIAAKLEELGIKLMSRTRTIMSSQNGEAAGREAGDKASFGRPIEGDKGVLRIGGGQ